jgi:hypothetical protein
VASVFVLVLALVVAACEGATVAPTESPSDVPTGSPSGVPTGSASEQPTAEPTGSPSVEPTGSPSGEPTVEPTPTESTGGPSSSPSAGGTGACLGSADTRSFFAAFATEVPWPVYCAVLPKGWSVEHGEYHLKNGGWLTISYRRRADGARIVLDEGAVCAETTPCVPAGTDLGSTPFGDRQADLSVSGGQLAAVVDETENPAWRLTGTDIDQDDFTSIAAKLHLLDQ